MSAVDWCVCADVVHSTGEDDMGMAYREKGDRIASVPTQLSAKYH